jgi:hypothetical protein
VWLPQVFIDLGEKNGVASYLFQLPLLLDDLSP